MKLNAKYLLPFILASALIAVSQRKYPIARFSFNNESKEDDINKSKARLMGANFIEDRFGNPGHAVYLGGYENSYINLGCYKALKPRIGSISLWIKIEGISYAGKGYEINPILLTKCAARNDFFESYAIYYVMGSNRLMAGMSLDSLKQTGVHSTKAIRHRSWYHLAITYNDDSLTFYVNGKRAGTTAKNYVTLFDPRDSVMVGSTANKKNVRSS